jgi:hypothetical protein
MSLDLLSEMLETLPFTLRDQIEGYAQSIDEVTEEIFRDARVEFSEELGDRLVFVAGIRRLWTITNSHYSILDNSLALIAEHDVQGFAVGSRLFTRQSAEFAEIRQLRDDLFRRLQQLGLEQYVLARTLRDVLLMLRGEAQDGHQ